MTQEEFEQNRQEAEPSQPETLETGSDQELFIAWVYLESKAGIDGLLEIMDAKLFLQHAKDYANRFRN